MFAALALDIQAEIFGSARLCSIFGQEATQQPLSLS